MKFIKLLCGLSLLSTSFQLMASNYDMSHLELTNAQGIPTSSLLLNAKADLNISGLTAKVTLTQTYKNQSSDWVSGKYLLPLPETAAIDSLTIKTANSVIVGEIKEKEEAKKIYKQAKRAGKKAALIESVRPNLFSTEVANIAPNSQIQVTVSYIQSVDFSQDEFSVTLPNTLTKRYTPRQYTTSEGKMQDEVKLQTGGFTQGNVNSPQTIKQDNSHNIAITASVETGFEISEMLSDHHAIKWSEQNGFYRVSLVDGDVAMNQDFILRWKATPMTTPQAAVFSQTLEGEDYINLMVMPPQQSLSQNVLPREMVFVIDSSGSMQGASMRQAKQALRKALTHLSVNDTFNVIDFDNKHRSLFTKPAYATEENIALAQQFISSMNADGGTEIRPALEAALGDVSVEGYLKQVVFLTDGAVGNEAEILASLKSKLGNNRVFTIGIGHAPNTYFMRKTAEYGRGTFTYINEIDQVEERVGKLFEQLKNPVLRDISLLFKDGSTPEMYPTKIPDLYLGEPLNVFIKVPNGASQDVVDVVVKGELLDEAWQRNVQFIQGQSSVGVAKNWARKKVSHLMDLEILGESQASIKKKVLETALKFSLASKYTSFVAIEQEISRPANESMLDVPVPNLIPKGVPFPKTATSAQLQAMLAFALLVLGLLLTQRRDVRCSDRDNDHNDNRKQEEPHVA